MRKEILLGLIFTILLVPGVMAEITGYDYREQVTLTSSASAGTTVPCVINTTAGFDLGTPTNNQFVWTQCTVGATDQYLYYNNNADYAVYNITSEVQDPMAVKTGDSSSVSPTDVFSVIDGTRIWYSLEDDLADSSGVSGGGTGSDMLYGDTPFVRGMESNTTNGFVVESTALVSNNVSNNFSVCFWFNQTVTAGVADTDRIVSIRANVGDEIDMNFLIWNNNETGACFRTTTSAYTCITSADDYGVDSGWHHFCYVKTGNDEVKGYWDGGNSSGGDGQELTGLGLSGDFGTGRNFCVGANGIACNAAGHEGFIDEIGYWNVSLTEDQVIALYEQGGMSVLGAQEDLNPFVPVVDQVPLLLLIPLIMVIALITGILGVSLGVISLIDLFMIFVVTVIGLTFVGVIFTI